MGLQECVVLSKYVRVLYSFKQLLDLYSYVQRCYSHLDDTSVTNEVVEPGIHSIPYMLATSSQSSVNAVCEFQQ
jgi:hypothetical protein